MALQTGQKRRSAGRCMGGANHQFRVGKIMKNLSITILIIIFMFLGNSVSAEDCPNEPSPVSVSLNRVLTHAEKEMEKGHNQEALQLLEDYTRKNTSTTHPQLPFLEGLIQYRLKRFSDAEASFKKAVKRDPCFGEAWQNLAAVYNRQKRPAEAAQALLKAFSSSHLKILSFNTRPPYFRSWPKNRKKPFSCSKK